MERHCVVTVIHSGLSCDSLAGLALKIVGQFEKWVKSISNRSKLIPIIISQDVDAYLLPVAVAEVADSFTNP